MKRPTKQPQKRDSVGRRPRKFAQTTGSRVELTANDVVLFEMYRRHGDIPLDLAHRYLVVRELAQDRQTTKKRHTRLFHEDNTAYGGTYLDRSPQQWLTDNSDYHICCHRNTSRADQVLKDNGRFIENVPKSSSSWKHDFLRSCFSLSMEIACLEQPSRFQYVSHDEIVDRIGKDVFVVEGERFRPDLMFGVKYLGGDKPITRLFMVEIDCNTEQLKVTKKKKHNTFESKLNNYRKYIAGGLYKDDFGLSGGLMLAVLTTNRGHMYELMKLVDKSNFMLFNYVPDFDWGFIPPDEIFPLLAEPWLRPGTDDFYINSVDGIAE